MTRFRFPPLLLILGVVALGASLSVTATTSAQMSFGLDEAEGEEEVEGDEASDDSSDGAMSFGEDDEETDDAMGGDAEGDSSGDETDDLVGDLGDLDDIDDEDEDAKLAETQASATEIAEEIFAVQQIYALRKNRLELAPSVGFTVNDPYVSHPSMGLAANFWFTNVLAVGANVQWYQGLETESDLNFHVRRSTRLAIRPTQFQVGGNVNFTYVPVYGKFAMFRRYIFQWDSYLIGGVGVLRTRPVPVVDPEVRSFEFGNRLSFNTGLGVRVFVSKWLTVFGELRDYVYLERLENLTVALDAGRADQSTWLSDETSIVNNVAIQLGLTVFFPFGFEYKLPK